MITRGLAALTLTLTLLVPVTLVAHEEFRFVGAVTKVDTVKRRISVKFKEADGKDETVEIALLPKTEITRDKKPVPRSQLRAGLYVVVDALGDDYDTLEALAIRIVPPPAR